MPTGYTANVADGTVTDLRTFALRCARGMGALYQMRDEPWDASLPERFEPGSYYLDRLTEANAELGALLAMTPEEKIVARDARHAAQVTGQADYQADKLIQRERYEAMIAQVRGWECTAPGLKEFMLSQLLESVDFDCRGSDRAPPEKMEVDDWHATAVGNAVRLVERYTKAVAEEIERTEARNAWLANLRASLPAQVEPF